jgi:hypothetical protein
VAVRSGGSLDQQTLNALSMVNPIDEQLRQDRLEAWYKEDGRDDKAHPMHALYTGLAEKYMSKEQGDA